MTFVLIFLLGIFVGSFLNVLADRLPRDESVVKGRSHCEKCEKTLKWHDLIPLFSFLQLRGKCRYCHSPLSFCYPIVELTTGVLFTVTFMFVSSNFQFLILNFNSIFNFKFLISLAYCLFIVSCLIVVFFADLKYGIIPDKIIFPAIAIALIFNFQFLIFNEFSIFNSLMSAVGACLFFLILALIKIRGRNAMGFGDVKFAFLMGLILGFPNIVVALYIAFLTGAIVGIILIVWRRKKVFGTSIPFGPFLVLGTFLALFWGNAIFQKVMPLLH
jgi:leader peptidase (prepilin peptidase) / N-methyltransferase